MIRSLLTPALALCALGCAAAVAFGTDARLAQYESGLDWICRFRRLQWPLVLASVAACVAVIALVVAGKRRAAWLLVLAPVLFLFFTRFGGGGDNVRRLPVVENPPFVSAAEATHLKHDAPVVGLVFEGQAYAYPAGALALAPVVAHADADRRLLLMYSPHAGRARAFAVDHTVKPRALEVASTPADALLLYNARVGQFVNAFTGLTPAGERPDGFAAPISTRRLTWREWRTLHPDTRVLATAYSAAREKPQPRFPPRPVPMAVPPETRVALLATTRPVAFQPAKFGTTVVPFNLSAGGSNVLLVRDKPGGPLRAYDRAVKGDLFPKFTRKSVPKKPEVAFADSDTGSLWTADGVCVDGYAKGERLRAIAIEEDVPYGTLKSFYPEVELLTP